MRLLRLLPTFTVLLLFSSSLFSQSYQWTKLPGPSGADFNTYYVADDQTSFCSTGKRGIYRWAGFAAQWTEANNTSDGRLDTLSAWGFLKLASGRLLVGTDLGVYFSDNLGVEWHKAEGIGFTVTNFFHRSDDSVLCLTAGGVYISDSLCETWKAYSMGSSYPYTIASIDDDRYLLGINGGLYLSPNKGMTFQRIAFSNKSVISVRMSKLEKIRLYALTLGLTGSELYRSDDTAKSWNPITLPIDQPTVNSVFCDDDDGTVYISLYQDIYKSTDFGATWLALDTLPWQGVYDFVKRGNGLVAVGGEDLVFFPVDNPGDFRFISDGISYPSLTSIAFQSDGTLYAAGTGGVRYSPNGGQDWVKERSRVTYCNQIMGLRNGTMVASTTYGAYYKEPGADWRQSAFQPDKNVRCGDMFEAVGDSFYYATASGVYLSTDLGKTASLAGLDGEFIETVLRTKSGKIAAGVFHIGFEFEVSISTDNGESWTEGPISNNFITDCALDSSGNLYLTTVGGNTVSQSTDDGSTWTQKYSGTEAFIGLLVHPNNDVYVLTPTSLIRSRNQGATWERIETGLSGQIDFALDASGTCYIATRDNGIYVSDRPLAASAPHIAATNSFAITDVYPNPASSMANVRFTAPATESTYLTVYNLLGKKVVEQQLTQQHLQSGFIFLNTFSLPTGTYRLVLGNGSASASRLMPVLR